MSEETSARILTIASRIRNVIQQAAALGLKDSDKVISSAFTEREKRGVDIEFCTVGELESCVQSLITQAPDHDEKL